MLADALVRPRRVRSLAGLWLHGLILTGVAGLVLALCGNPLVAGLVALGLVMALSLISNAKNAMLGEPLLFSDLALLVAVYRHPQFYLSALQPWQLRALAVGAAGLVALFAWLFVPALLPHLIGLGLAVGAVGLIALSLQLPPWRRLAPEPAAIMDVARHGLLASLLLYWRRWKATDDPHLCTDGLPQPPTTQLVVVVQCESFADPAELFGDSALALPGLAAARAAAWRQGHLLVSGFGAYTNRTEYGVIFGRDEETLGFRRFDPFLTAMGEASHALPARLARHGWRNLFVHPHDLGFYSRDTIMPAAGFAEMVGPEAFAMPAKGEHRYVSDEAIADVIMDRARAAREPGLFHAVTIENHGPWPADKTCALKKQSSAYLELVARGDAMLSRLMADVAALKRPALLAFYGDHRPSIPGACMPGGDRHTPYVLLRYDAEGQLVRGCGTRRDLTPAQFHHALIDAISA
ncbi:LTA synthase family protein [Sandarakinorhabdus oryzae]|uniref:LTA synthase family protein n=1 Tax=Sandarakinorhabdus oryzae TaxID=2675220 RepID=UPI001F3DD9A4|nr:sulfatase-like hydrolase/transferase [Sandarakinorhabdus oryzae]